MRYIEGSQKGNDECLFCEAVKAGSDRENMVLHRGKACFVMLNAFPYNPGHLMVAPNRHVASLGALTAEERAEIMELAALAEKLLAGVYQPQGFNLGVNLGRCAGAGVPGHLHLHIVPRWEGDTNFMPVMSETRVMPEELGTTYQKLYEALKAAKEGQDR